MKYNFCPNCGFKLEDNFRFCPMCGMDFSRSPSTPVQPAQNNYTEKTVEYSKPQSGIEKAKDLFEHQDYAQALAYLIEYANSDNADALYMIGFCLYKTKKTDPNCEKFLKLAADLGHPLAQATLGELYYTLAEEWNLADFQQGYNPYLGIPEDKFEEAKEKCELYYSLALRYLSMAKSNGVK